MIQYGSSNAQYFMIHPSSTRPSFVGTTFSSRDGHIDHFGIQDDYINPGILRSRYPGEEWGWNYQSNLRFPEVQCVRNSNDDIIYLWEADMRVDYDRLEYPAIITIDPVRDVSIIPVGGSFVYCNFPLLSDMESIESLVNAASSPAWLSDTRYSGLSNTRLLLALYKYEQGRLDMPSRYKTIGETFNHDMRIQIKHAYILAWLRCASRILYSHYGQTCIPLLLDKFSCDSNGNLALT